VGAIAGGVIGGVIIIALIVAFAWYKLRPHEPPSQENLERFEQPPPAPYYPEQEPRAEKSINNAPEAAIRNMEETGPVSGNLGGRY